ncbi:MULTISPECIES: glycosyltransferase [unclassified Tolypothrix]|uniref:glycosyltransferase n=1 Tax=unclassified Tolypothrix TaxID=2649714 RepID=UPI0005EAAE82|nr:MULTISPECIES: glycosyltransferase [unclassified Tolypothrix]BAY90365.1 glycosyl transferase family 28 [Microchaete diplosiphon NIES-3275]EKE98642.1 UDP-glucoronosyl and UDP-glucosyl transferase [Tolypothrix sp. PCC 7601]MBE9084281.1 glycosyltransferase family 1 protein [Tolypothrix sp. LEGE 11397]UYD24543.1 glycosyltransferase family 1 protein [Tolypothrix sp. PCC 7712]UYD33228.1 glycosyltransferase family 1 protein [Tolypothrix sp. PCC 7601]
MRIAIIALGSRGDVQPYIALGKGLKAAGHFVRLLSHENFADLVSSYELEFSPMHGNVQEIVESQEMRQLLETGNFLKITAYTAQQTQRAAINWAQAGLLACQGMDLLVSGVGGLYLGISLSEKLNVPLLQAYVFPFTPTKTFPGVLFPQSLAKFGGTVNWLSHHAIRQIMWHGSRTGDALARKQVLNLPVAPFFGPYQSAHLHRYPTLYGISPSVIPKPSDWQNTHVTGYWFLDAAPNWTPPSALIEFLESGPPPVYIGFGSMGNRNPEQTAELVLQALETTQQRAIILSGWGGISTKNLPDNVYLVDSIPHSWLFERVAAIVHHGGAGTTAAGLRAGVPTIIIPFFGDQSFWGQRVAQLGVCTEPIPRQQLTAEGLAQAIRQAMSDQTMRQRAAHLGATIRDEDGIANAVSAIQTITNLRAG